MRRGKVLCHRIQRFNRVAIVEAQASHYTDTLWLDENLSFGIFLRPEHTTIIIVSTTKPLSIPAGRPDGSFHFFSCFLNFAYLCLIITVPGNTGHFLACQHEQSSDKHAFRNLPVFVRRRLERLTRCVGKAV